MLEISPHAVERYKERSRQFNLSDDQARAALTEIAEWGQILGRHRGCYFVEYQNQVVVIDRSKETGIASVRTYLGDRSYIHWMSHGWQINRLYKPKRKPRR